MFLLTEKSGEDDTAAASSATPNDEQHRSLASLTKWQQVVAKLIPVNLARVQDSPAIVSHVTAYSSKVDKILDVVLYWPGDGTRSILLIFRIRSLSHSIHEEVV